MRVRFGPIALPPGLRRGQHRELDAAEVGRMLAGLDIQSPQTLPLPAQAPGAGRERPQRQGPVRRPHRQR